MKASLTMIMCAALVSCSSLTHTKKAVAAHDVGDKFEIIGDLGLPVGTPVTITGIKRSNGPYDCWFAISTIDGKKANQGILIEEISHWPNGTEATLRGKEIGSLYYSNQAGGNYGPNDSRWKGPQQSLTLTFKIESIVTPKKLSLQKH